MKCYGKVSEYDGYTGIIRGEDGRDYLLLKSEINDGDILVFDYVSFDAECYQDIEINKFIARFVKKLEKK